MKVILLDELKGRGGEGDVIEVATGYAVNFLFPRKIAISATKGNLKQLEQRKHNIAKREEKRIDTADKLMAALEGQRIQIGAKVGEEGQLFGSVTPAQVADAINTKFDVEIDRRRIDLHGIIKTAGEHTATVSIYRDTKADIVIEVVNEALLKKESAASVEDNDADITGADDAGADADIAGADAADADGADADTADTSDDTVVNPEDVIEALDVVEAELEDLAETVAEIADSESEDGTEAAVAEAAVEVLRDVEEVIDAAVADIIATEVEEQIAAADEDESQED
jgi:large subunit ribosomal protein L9